MSASILELLSPPAPAHPQAPPVPTSVSETGLSEEFLSDLLLKTLYVRGAMEGQHLMDGLCLPFPILDDILITLQQRKMVEVRGTRGSNRITYIFDLTQLGRERSKEAMEQSQYVGPAPVALSTYRHWLSRQSVRHLALNRRTLEEGFRHIVLAPHLFETLGPGINSGKSLFLYGDPGNGKTLIAEAIASLIEESMYLPYAVDLGGQIMVIYDPIYHRHVPQESSKPETTSALWKAPAEEADRRFARVYRPMVSVGGELTLDQLDFRYDSSTKIYQAPFQVKANGGVLIIDDFGRQRVPPSDLLNRWIVPLEKGTDFLTLHTGSKFPLPFDCLLVFATNIAPNELADEAFLRRIQYKIHIPSPTPDQYREIFRRVCESSDVEYRSEAVDYIYQEVYEKRRIAPRACHPRDLLEHVRDAARFRECEPTLSHELLDEAFLTYFITIEALAYQRPTEGA